ncbi:MAG: AraC family transcriptional regulator, partial [Burkholderiaceae bacterium]|nr:AraC family transcriptional regulator [Burkholderiaceae bacterium]
MRPGFTLVAFSALLDVLRLAADEGDGSRPVRCRWSVLGSTQDPIPASCGVRVLPDEHYGDPSRFDVIVVVGGVLRLDPSLDAQTRAFLHAADQSGRVLVGLCTGSITLLRAGLLDGRKCCLHHYHLRDVEGRFPLTEIVADQLFVVDGRYVTCAGGSAVADVGAWLIERQFGRGAARKCMDMLLLDGARA